MPIKKLSTYNLLIVFLIFGGTDQIRTGAQGVADPRLTAWLRFHKSSFFKNNTILLYFIHCVNKDDIMKWGEVMGKLYIVRHGKTEWNDLNIAQGSKDIPLNEEGIKTATQLSKEIDLSNIDFCISSPMQRAKQTAIILCNNKIPIIYDERLKERSFGDYEGKSMSMDIVKQQWDYNLNTSDNNIESIKECLDRANSFLNDIIKKYSDKNILIVSHGCLIKCLHYCINGYNENTDFFDFSPKNATLYEYEMPDIKKLAKC